MPDVAHSVAKKKQQARAGSARKGLRIQGRIEGVGGGGIRGTSANMEKTEVE
jgi:hypothetical protein